MTNILGRIQRTLTRTPPHHPSMPEITTTPEMETGRVIFCGFSSGGLKGNGKVNSKRFFPAFCKVLHQAGLATHFVTTPEEMVRLLTPGDCLVHIYREEEPEHITLYTKAMELVTKTHPTYSGLVFNAPELGQLIANKVSTNTHLVESGIAVPRILTSADDTDDVFCNDLDSTGAAISRTFDPARYNTQFIDTRVPYKGKEYYTTVRLLCVSGTLIHCNVGARDISEGASVHGRDAPVDPELLEHLQDVLVHSRIDALTDLAQRLGAALGPGFFGHDLVICSKTGIPHVCEVGFKFDARAYYTHLTAVAGQLPSHSDLFDGTYEALAGQAFLAEYNSYFSKTAT